MKPQGIIFDLDDTLIAFSDYSLPCWESAFHELQDSLPGISWEEFYSALRKTSSWYWSDLERHRLGRNNMRQARREITQLACTALNIDDREAVYKLADRFSALRETRLALFDGALQTLSFFQNKGMPMVLLTNGEAGLQNDKIDRFALRPFFKQILIEGEVGYGKPDPRSYHNAGRALGAKLTELWCIGDNLVWEVEAPQQLGIFCVWHDFKNKGIPEGSLAKPDAVIKQISQLPALYDTQSY